MKQSIFEASDALQKWEGIILKKTRLFCWFSSNSEVGATWASLISWPKHTSMREILVWLDWPHKMSTVKEVTIPSSFPSWFFVAKISIHGTWNFFTTGIFSLSLAVRKWTNSFSFFLQSVLSHFKIKAYLLICRQTLRQLLKRYKI